MRRALVGASILLLGSCGSEPILPSIGGIAADHDRLEFGVAFVGSGSTRTLRIQNQSRSGGRLVISLTGPFGVRGAPERLTAGEIAALEVEFRPTEAGHAIADMKVVLEGLRPISVALTGEGTTRSIHTEARVDFGSVPVGATSMRELVVSSPSLLPIGVRVALTNASDSAFSTSASSLSIPAGRSATLGILYSPVESVGSSAFLELRPCPSCEVTRVALSGDGETSRIVVSPGRLEFGYVPVGDRRELFVDIRSEGRAAWFAAMEITAGPGGAFAASTPELPVTLRSPALVGVTFEPRSRGDAKALLRLDISGTVHEVKLEGAGGQGPVETTPAKIDFGLWPFDVSGSRSVLLSGAGAYAVEVQAIRITEDPLAQLEVIPSFPLPVTLSGSGLSVNTALEPQRLGDITSHLRVDTDHGPQLFPVTGRIVAGAECDLLADPSTVTFGLVPVGSLVERSLVLRNLKNSICTIDSVQVVGPGFELVEGTPEQLEIQPEGSVSLRLRFAPKTSSISLQTARLTFRQASTRDDVRVVDLTGQAILAQFHVDPSALALEPAQAGEARLIAIEIHNDGLVPLRLDRQLVAGSESLTLVAPASSYLPAGARSTAFIGFVASGFDTEGEFLLHLRGASEPVRVPIELPARSGRCTTCQGPLARCPPTRSAWLPRGVSLEGAGLDPTGGEVSCAWTVVEAPDGSSASPSPSDACGAVFDPDLEGKYTFQLVVRAPGGSVATCETRADVGSFGGIAIRATWSSPEGVDIHLFDPGVGRMDDPAILGTVTQHCWRENPRPIWGRVGTGDDPACEGDFSAPPQAAWIEEPAVGTRYELLLHWADSDFVTDFVAVQTSIYCAGSPVHLVETTLDRPYEARHVGTIEATEQGCDFTPGSASMVVHP